MKKLLLILLCLPLLFNSCKKEEDITNNANITNNNLPLTYQNIEGWWKYKYSVMGIYYTTFGETTFIQGELDTTSGYDSPLFISTDSMIFTGCSAGSLGYSIINGKLKISTSDTSVNCVIMKLTNNHFYFHIGDTIHYINVGPSGTSSFIEAWPGITIFLKQ